MAFTFLYFKHKHVWTLSLLLFQEGFLSLWGMITLCSVCQLNLSNLENNGNVPIHVSLQMLCGNEQFLELSWQESGLCPATPRLFQWSDNFRSCVCTTAGTLAVSWGALVAAGLEQSSPRAPQPLLWALSMAPEERSSPSQEHPRACAPSSSSSGCVSKQLHPCAGSSRNLQRSVPAQCSTDKANPSHLPLASLLCFWPRSDNNSMGTAYAAGFPLTQLMETVIWRFLTWITTATSLTNTFKVHH